MQSPKDVPFSGQDTDGDAKPASRMHQMGARAAEAIDEKRETLSRGMDAAADYVREQDLESMLSDARDILKKHPGAVLLSAVAIGFLIARGFTRH